MDSSRDTRARGPSHATVVAYLALFVALGGTATALKGQVDSDDLARNSVTRGKIAAKAVNARRLAPRSVTTSRLVPAAVVNRILGANSVTTDKILDGGVMANDIAVAAVGGGKIAKSAVGSSEIKSDAIGTGKIKDAAVSEAQVADGAVSEGKIKAGAVTGSKLATGSIPVGKLSSLVVTASDPLVAGLGRPHLAFVQTAHLADGASLQPIATVTGAATYLASCNAGSQLSYRNDGDNPQTVITDPDEDPPDLQVIAASATGTPVPQSTPTTHATVFSFAPVSGLSVHAEVFGVNAGAAGCDFYTWAISRSA